MKRGATAGRLAGTVTSRQERKTRTGNKMGVIAFSDQSGQYEAVLFSEALAQFRDLLEPGKSVVIDGRGRGAAGRHQPAHPDGAVAGGRGEPACRRRCASIVRDASPVSALAGQLATRGEGQVSFIVIKEGGQGEVEIALPERYRISPQIASAMRAVPGVVEVELV